MSLHPVTTASTVDAFVAALPKVDLHLHLMGSASPATVALLAARYPDAGVPTDVEAVRELYTFRNFAHFIEVYLAVAALVRSGEDIALLVRELGDDLARQSVRYAEVTVTPHTHAAAGIADDEVADALERARADVERTTGVRLRWCFDIDGGFGRPAADVTLRMALRNPPAGLVGFGLGGPEIGVGRAQFARQFLLAREAGLHSVPHAGETTGPRTVWSAIHDLGAERIGHGTSAIHDPYLVSYLREHRIPLEVCPTSNLRTQAIRSYAEHPLPRLLDEGVVVTIGSDDPPMFGTDLNREYVAIAREYGLLPSELAELARNGVRAAFLDQPAKAELLAEIDTVEAAWRDGQMR